MLGYADWIVGGVAILLGVALCFSAVTSSQRLFELPKIRWLESRLGRQATQAILAIIGVALLIVGITVTLGWKINWHQRRAAIVPVTSGTYWV